VHVRNCAWTPVREQNPPKGKMSNRPVWARMGVVSMACPKSIITVQSLELLERFSYWKSAGGGSLMNEHAKVADAIVFLNEQWLEEQDNGEIKK
jgi:hypothetical protein